MVTASPTIEATIEGTVSGQLAVGSYILQVGNIHGGVVNFTVPGTQQMAQPRPRPVIVKPRPFPGLLDRENETATIQAAVDVLSPVSLAGRGGSGKTVLLRRVAHLPGLRNFSDGLVYLAVKEKGLDDVLQLLFDIYYSSPTNTKQTDGEIRQGLQNINALILLDDVLWQRDAVESLLNVMPASLFVFASATPLLWGEGHVVELNGLPDQYACQLFEKGLGRTLSEQEMASVKEMVAALEYHPLRILQLAAFARKAGTALSEIRDQVQARYPETSTVLLSMQRLSESQEKILAILGAADGAVVPLQHLAGLSRVGNLQLVLDELLSLGLIQAHGPRYSLTTIMSAALPRLWKLSAWEDVLINYFSQWVVQNPSQELMEESSELLMQTIRKAGEKNMWQDVVQIGRALEPCLILWKRWQAWSELADLILTAARALGNRALEAWTLHQMGTRAMCLGIPDQARELLNQALVVRQAIGDRAGRAVTEHNLNVLNGGFVPPQPTTNKTGGSGGGLGCFNTLVLWLVLLGVGTFLLLRSISPGLASTEEPQQPTSGTLTQGVATPTPFVPVTGMETTSVPPTPTFFAPNPAATSSPLPTMTPTVTPTSTPIPCLLARWVRDVSILDETSIQRGTAFVKTWELKNEGSCTWDHGYQIIFVSGDSMSTQRIFPWTGGVVVPGASVQLSVTLVAPYQPGTYQSNFLLLAPNGTIFGLDAQNNPFWARILVPTVIAVTPDWQGPNPPILVGPANFSTIYCSSSQLVAFAWKEAPDPSGIAAYELQVEVWGGEKWFPAHRGETTTLSLELEMNCGYYYSWRVRARDGAGNWGNFGEYQSFHYITTRPNPR